MLIIMHPCIRLVILLLLRCLMHHIHLMYKLLFSLLILILMHLFPLTHLYHKHPRHHHHHHRCLLLLLQMLIVLPRLLIILHLIQLATLTTLLTPVAALEVMFKVTHHLMASMLHLATPSPLLLLLLLLSLFHPLPSIETCIQLLQAQSVNQLMAPLATEVCLEKQSNTPIFLPYFLLSFSLSLLVSSAAPSHLCTNYFLSFSPPHFYSLASGQHVACSLCGINSLALFMPVHS